MKRLSSSSLFIIFCLFFASSVGIVPKGFAANQLREIVMKDGSVIMAEVLSYQNGVYTLHSANLGKLQVQDSAISSIRLPGETTEENSVPSTGDVAQQPTQRGIQEARETVLSNPGLLEMVLNMQNDPEVQDILQDPEIMALISAGDVQKLETKPKFIKLMENPKIRALLTQMTQ
jgi:hypothetical protein